ncbi:uncharacterized protein LOC128214357 [Mya arenaria]|uniref:uncharacterized protein LOC128214357 n=1 Tax=Mya arenaria TaxID=6604 RepID=UPI0022E36BDE|nr:uncharacterized protein LOC128214357 [Mya arenaria]
MGLTLGLQYSHVTEGDVTRCVPKTRFRPLPATHRKSSGTLIFETMAYPMDCWRNRKTSPESVYWWCDGQFVPNDDCSLFIAGGAFNPRTTHAWISILHARAGRVIKLDMSGDIIGGEHLTDTSMANFPKLQMHPSGHYFSYIGPESVMIETTDHEPVYSRCKDLRMCNHKFCAFSPNGKYIAIIQTHSRHIELVLSRLDKGSTAYDTGVTLSALLKDFRSQAYNEHIECKWSPDSEYILICSNIDFMFVLNKQLELVVNITRDILPDDAFPSWAGSFDYDPRYLHDMAAVGCKNRCVYFVNIGLKEVIRKSATLGQDSIDCLTYHPQGLAIAVACRDFNIFILDSENAELVFQIDMKFTLQELTHKFASFPSVMRVEYNTVGEQLAVSTSDGRVRMWQLPVQISLFDQCKWTILAHVPAASVEKLPLPRQIVLKLLNFPTLSGSGKTDYSDINSIECTVNS